MSISIFEMCVWSPKCIPLRCVSVAGWLRGASSSSGRWELSGTEGGDELSARARGQVTSALGRSRKRLRTHTYQVCLSALNHWYTSTEMNNGQLISSVWLSADLLPIPARLGSIPRPPLGLKWDDMGFFMSTKIGGILAFALGKTSRAPSWVLFRLRATLDALVEKTIVFLKTLLHLKCHCLDCHLYLSPSVMHDGYERCWAVASSS